MNTANLMFDMYKPTQEATGLTSWKQILLRTCLTNTNPYLSSGAVPGSGRVTGNTSAAETLKRQPPLENAVSAQD
ncbi:unnamed protein product [Lota lota]